MSGSLKFYRLQTCELIAGKKTVLATACYSPPIPRQTVPTRIRYRGQGVEVLSLGGFSSVLQTDCLWYFFRHICEANRSEIKFESTRRFFYTEFGLPVARPAAGDFRADFCDGNSRGTRETCTEPTLVHARFDSNLFSSRNLIPQIPL